MDNLDLKKKIMEKQSISVIEAIPTALLLELTNACNHACLFCSHRKMTRKVQHMNFELACRIIEEGYQMGIREIGLFMSGESLLYQRLDEIIKFAKKTGYDYVYITSNGALANLELMKKLISSGLDSIKFSINAVSKQEYCLIHGKDEFDLVVENVKNLYDYRKKEKLSFKIFISSVSTKYNNSEERIKKHLGDLCDSIAIYQASNADGLVPEVDIYLRDNSEKYDICNDAELPCRMVFNRIHVSCEGYVTACCLDVQNCLAYADVNNISLVEAWNCEIIREFRERHLKGEVEGTVCYNCINRTREKVTPLNDQLSSGITKDMLEEYGQIEERIAIYNEKKML